MTIVSPIKEKSMMSTEFDLRLQSPEWEEGGPKSWNWFKIKGWKSRTPEYILVFEYANNRLVWFTCDVGEVENSPQGGEEAGIGGADLDNAYQLLEYQTCKDWRRLSLILKGN